MKRCWSFSLIELLVVIGLIAILVSLLLPALKAARATAYGTVCLSNLKQFHTAILCYLSDNNDVFPPQARSSAAPWNNAIEPQYQVAKYLKIKVPARSVLYCPADRRPFGARNQASSAHPDYVAADGSNYVPSSYCSSAVANEFTGVFWMAGGKSIQSSSLANPSKLLLFSEGAGYWYLTRWQQNFYLLHGTGCNFLYADGHAGWFSFGYPEGTTLGYAPMPQCPIDANDSLWVR